MNYFYVTIVLVLFSCGEAPVVEEEFVEIVKKKTVKTLEIKAQNDLQYQIPTNGRLILNEELNLKFLIGGTIKKGITERGRMVKKGELLAEISINETELNLQQAELGKRQAQAAREKISLAIKQAQKEYDSIKNLYQDKATSVDKLDQAKAKLDNLLASKKEADLGVDLSNTKIDLFKASIQNMQLLAPEDGRILEVFVAEGEQIRPFQPIFLMNTSNKLQFMEVNLVDKDFVQVAPRDKVSFSFDAFPGKTFEGEVYEKGVLPDKQTGSYPVKLSFVNNQKLQMPLGLFGEASISTKLDADLIKIPLGAIINAHELQAEVFVVENMRAKRKKILIYKISGEHLLVREGLEIGDILITDDVMLIQENEEITF